MIKYPYKQYKSIIYTAANAVWSPHRSGLRRRMPRTLYREHVCNEEVFSNIRSLSLLIIANRKEQQKILERMI